MKSKSGPELTLQMIVFRVRKKLKQGVQEGDIG
jgi:hypothetical protein